MCTMILAACSIEVSSQIGATPETKVSSLTASPTQPPGISLKLSGHLIYIQDLHDLIKLDLASGEQTTLFHVPDNAWLKAASVSPDGKRIVLAYEPPSDDPSQFGYSDLYVMSADGSDAPKLFQHRSRDYETFFNPVWSADGNYIYYSHEVPDNSGHPDYIVVKYQVERATYPGGQPQKLVDNAYWPRPSHDGSKLAYVSFDPKANTNDLYVANPDGSNAKLVLPAQAFDAVDAPLFSPDDNMVMFSAVVTPQVSQLSWFDLLTGVETAEAHNVPSEWWRVSIDGGKPEQLTHIADTGMYGDFAPDAKHVAFVSASGLYVMAPDGSNLVQVYDAGPIGTVNWIP